MAWTEEARQASIEARKASAKTKEFPSAKSHPEGREGKIADHKDAAKMHENAAKVNRAAGNEKEAEHHDKMAELHGAKSQEHAEKNSAALEKQTERVQKENKREDKINAANAKTAASPPKDPTRPTGNSQKAIQERIRQRMVSEDKKSSWHGGDNGHGQTPAKVDVGDKARQATKDANAATAKASRAPTEENHFAAKQAHEAAAGAHRNVEQDRMNKNPEFNEGRSSIAANHHEAMAREHGEARQKIEDKIHTDTAKSERANRAVSPMEKMAKQIDDKNEKARAEKRGTPEEQMKRIADHEKQGLYGSKSTEEHDDNHENAMQQAKHDDLDTKIASGNAKIATEKARASGGSEDHDLASVAHHEAADTHRAAEDAKGKSSGHNTFYSSRVDHHQKMAEMHSTKAKSIREKAAKAVNHRNS